MSAQAGKENENDPSTDCPPQMGRKLAAGTMPNRPTTDPPLLVQLFLHHFRESIVITDKEILFFIDRDARARDSKWRIPSRQSIRYATRISSSIILSLNPEFEDHLINETVRIVRKE